jgi:hypothetical protein
MKTHLYTAILAIGIAMSQPYATAAQTDLGFMKAQQVKKKTDTIPFFLKDSRIYFKGELNGRKDLNLMFDLGAGMACINSKSAAVSAINFDATINVQNLDGINKEPSASRTRLRIAGMRWTEVPIVQVRNLDKDDDLIVGNSLFKNKVLEIDYDKKIMIVTDSLEKDLAGYSKSKVTYFQDRPLFMVQVKVGNRFYPFPFLFDTGRDGTMLIGEDFSAHYGLWNQYHSLVKLGNKKIVVIPELKIGTRTFRDIVTNANDPKHPNGKQSLIGNELLNQFNVILDNRNGMIYLMPNTKKNENYATYQELKIHALLVLVIALVLVLLIVYFVRKRLRA